MRNFHCCASCKNFVSSKKEGKIEYSCERLGFMTKPTYVFNCWDPKENVKKLMEKERNR